MATLAITNFNEIVEDEVDAMVVVLRQMRVRHGLTQAQAARLAGLSRPHLSNIEAGKVPGVSVEAVARLARVYGASLEEVAAAAQATTAGATK